MGLVSLFSYNNLESVPDRRLPLAQPIERLLTRKLPLKSYTPAGEFDPQRTLVFIRKWLSFHTKFLKRGLSPKDKVHSANIWFHINGQGKTTLAICTF